VDILGDSFSIFFFQVDNFFLMKFMKRLLTFEKFFCNV